MSPPIGTLVCPACGGAVPKTSTACAYCGAVVVLPPPRGSDLPSERRTFCPRCGTLYPSAAGRCPGCPAGPTDERGGRCPRCAGELESKPMGRATVDVCPGCHGIWFDGDELEHAIDVTTSGVSRDEATTLRRGLPPPGNPNEEVHYVACVRCGERMARRQLAMRVGIVVDVCRAHGVWFDGGEFEEFQAFVRAGGLEVLRYDGVAQSEERRKMAELRERSMVPMGSDSLEVGWRRPGRGLDLGYDVLSAIRRFFRGGW